ncbi:NUDIX hydrolase [Aestuariispira insulae]|nr:NUDIX domain-containing protein [Aestuariispira insulae]
MADGERFKLPASVFVMAREAGRVLLLRRNNTGWMDGHFSLPAGRIKGGETLVSAARRELEEETSLVAKESALFLAHVLHSRNEDGQEWTGYFFECSRFDGSPYLNEPNKHDRLGWYEADQYPSPLVPYVAQALSAIRCSQPFSAYGWAATG